MKFFNLLTIFLLSYLCSAHYVVDSDNDVNKTITKREEYLMNNLWSDACNLFGLFGDGKNGKSKVAKVLKRGNYICEMGNIIFKIGEAVGIAKDNYRGHAQIPKGECQMVSIRDYGTTEICSHGPEKLYGDWRSVSVYGCYAFGTYGTESYTECCVVNTGSTGVTLDKKMCSRPEEGLDNVNDFKFLSYPHCAHRTALLNEQCGSNGDSSTCEYLAETMINECQAHPLS